MKHTRASWRPAFARLASDSKAWAIGYTEMPWEGEMIKSMPRSDLIGNGMYILKPRTPLTREWFAATQAKMDRIHKQLERYPSRGPRQVHSVDYPYPLQWEALLGDIFHPLVYKHRAHVLHGLPPASFSDYREGGD